jgi:AcrR family transcriptional regulator
MPNKRRPSVRKSTSDPRVQRTAHAMGSALAALMRESEWSDVTVQHILDRAGIGRATFYAHYRNKQDALHSSFEGLFTSLERVLDQPRDQRLFPLAELLEHVAESSAVLLTLTRSGDMEEMWQLAVGFASRTIERRVGRSMPSVKGDVALVSRMLAGAMIESARWWLAHREARSPRQMDVAFHEIARSVLTRRELFASDGPGSRRK